MQGILNYYATIKSTTFYVYDLSLHFYLTYFSSFPITLYYRLMLSAIQSQLNTFPSK